MLLTAQAAVGGLRLEITVTSPMGRETANIMTITAEGRTRPRLVKLAAGLTLAGSAFTLIGAEVGAQTPPPVSPPLNLTATNIAGPGINIDWDAPTTGSPPTYYQVTIDNESTALDPDLDTFVPATQTHYLGYATTPSTEYTITVESNDENTFAAATITHTTPPSPPVECATAVWTPFCTVDAFTRQQYGDWLERMPTLDELNFWRDYLEPRDQTGAPPQPDLPATGTQNAFLEMLREEKDVKAGPVLRLYIAYFLRNAEYGGYNFWLQAVTDGGWTMGQVSEFFAASPEFQARYGSLDDGEFVSLVYQNVLGRNPDAAGYAFWTRQLQQGHSRGWMMMQFTEAPSLEHQTRTRIAVVTTEVYAEMLNRSPSLAEYDAATFLMAGTPYPVEPAFVNPLYLQILNSAEYRARITIR